MKSFLIIEWIIIINGIYNIIAALCILNLLQIPYIRNVYFDMITDYDNNNIMFERFVAYTMLANGIIRVLNGMTLDDRTSQYVVSGTFFLEALILSIKLRLRRIMLLCLDTLMVQRLIVCYSAFIV